jgi:hypothetical protein
LKKFGFVASQQEHFFCNTVIGVGQVYLYIFGFFIWNQTKKHIGGLIFVGVMVFIGYEG